MHFLAYFEKLNKIFIIVLSFIIIFIVGFLDYITGNEIAFSLFYLIPIIIVTWPLGQRTGLLMSILCALVWQFIDIESGTTLSHPLIYVWNTIIVFGFFIIVTILLTSIKNVLELEKEMARTDFLTGVTNSRSFYKLAKIEIDRTVRFNRAITMAYIDIDNFKQVNDTRGHDQGDGLLRLVAQTIKNNIRSIDIVSRLGGDEFAIIFPETNESEAKIVISKMQKEILNVIKNNNWPITFSIGVITCYKLCSYANLIKQADHLMYTVKNSGKNRIEYKIYEISEDECK